MKKNQIPNPGPPSGGSVNNTTKLRDGTKKCCLSFRFYKPGYINIKSFNNHFKDAEHYQIVLSSFIETVLPRVSDLTINELMSGQRITKLFHFHQVERDKYDKVRSVLKEYNFNDIQIEQILDGENLYQFAGNIEGGKYAARIICEYIEGIIYILFFDTNHHIFLDKKKTGESLAFSFCPYEKGNECYNAFNCFVKDYLDIEKINETFNYNYSSH